MKTFISNKSTKMNLIKLHTTSTYHTPPVLVVDISDRNVFIPVF